MPVSDLIDFSVRNATSKAHKQPRIRMKCVFDLPKTDVIYGVVSSLASAILSNSSYTSATNFFVVIVKVKLIGVVYITFKQLNKTSKVNASEKATCASKNYYEYLYMYF